MMSRSSKVRPELVNTRIVMSVNVNDWTEKTSLARVVICSGKTNDLLEVLIEAGRASPELLEDLSQFRTVQLHLKPFPHIHSVRIGVVWIGLAEVEELFGDGVGEFLAPVLCGTKDEDRVARQHGLEAQVDKIVRIPLF